MNDSNARPRLLRFGVFEVDLRTAELRKQGLKVKLHGQPFQVLALLLERPGELVTREEIREKLWPGDTFIDFEHSVNSSIKRLREALGDDPAAPRFIETLPRHGYRFIAPVDGGAMQELPLPATGPTAIHESPLRRYWVVTVASGLLVALVAVLFAFNVAGLRERVLRAVGAVREPPLQIRSIAVLPLENLSGDPSQEYFADAMTDELITDLGKVSALRVISRNSVMLYKGKRKPTPEIARELNVDAVVEGAVMRSGERVRITAQLIQARTDSHIWTEKYERNVRDVLSLQSEVARAIAEEIRIKSTPQERARMASARPVDPEAYDAYMRGQRAMADPGTEDIAMKYFQQAIEKDPNFARAYAGLADAYTQLGNDELASPQESYPKGKAAALRALEIDDTLAEAHLRLGWGKMRFDWDWSGAESQYKQALRLGPSSAEAHAEYGEFLMLMGRCDEAKAEIKQAQELDPLSAHSSRIMGVAFWHSRQYGRAIEQLRQTIENFHLEDRDTYAHFHLARSYKGKGMFKEAIAEQEKAVALFPESPLYLGMLGNMYSLAGKKAQALKVVDQLKEWSKRKYVAPYDIALVYIGLGDKDQAFALLEKAYQAHSNDMSNLKADPTFDPLRSDPRFQDFLRRMNFPP